MEQHSKHNHSGVMNTHEDHMKDSSKPTRYTDPVCGMSTDDNTFLPYFHDGQTYYFCSEDCLAKFKEAPERYLHKTAHTHEHHAHQSTNMPPMGTKYTCPMHPEIRQHEPGHARNVVWRWNMCS